MQTKKQYVTPTLKEHGAVREITQSGSGSRKNNGMTPGMNPGMSPSKGMQQFWEDSASSFFWNRGEEP